MQTEILADRFISNMLYDRHGINSHWENRNKSFWDNIFRCGKMQIKTLLHTILKNQFQVNLTYEYEKQNFKSLRKKYKIMIR